MANGNFLSGLLGGAADVTSGSILGSMVPLDPILRGADRRRREKEIDEILGSRRGPGARRAGQAAALAARRRGLTGGAGAAFEREAVNDFLRRLAMARARMRQRQLELQEGTVRPQQFQRQQANFERMGDIFGAASGGGLGV